MDNSISTVLSCTNPHCPCRLRIEVPCPHGDGYRCACGHPLDTVHTPLLEHRP